MSRKETVKKAAHFQEPDRIPLSYPYDLKQSDIVNVEVTQNFMGPEKNQSEWGFVWDHLENSLTMGQPKEPVIKSWEDLASYTAPDPFRPDRFEAMEKALADLGPDHYYKANLVISGFTTMWFLRGFSETLADLCLDRDNLETLADVVFGFENQLLRQLKAAGFDAISLADDWGTQKSLFISPKLWREIFKPRYRQQFALAHECGLDVYFHCCGYIYDIIPDLIEIGLDILNPGQPNINNIPRMGKDFAGKICFACPVSYQTTGISGSKEEIQREVHDLASCLGTEKGGIIGLIPTDLVGLGANPENAQYMLDAFRNFRRTTAGSRETISEPVAW
jgi:uroporphyrinogen decarboxylase